MKKTLGYVRLGLAGAVLGWRLLYASASTIHFTYDPAGRLVLADYGSNRTASYAYDNAGNLLLSSAPSPGIIIASLTNGQLTLLWSALPAGFTLQSATVLGSDANWADTGLKPVAAGGLLSVTVPVGPGATFYRLRN